MKKMIGNNKMRLRLMLIASIIIAGCATSGGYYTVSFGSGSMTAENGTFYMDGEISIGTGAQPEATFTNITVTLYDKDREVIKRVKIGKLSTVSDIAPLSRYVEIRSDIPPEYVVIESPDFWTSKATVKVLAYQRTSTGYKEYFRERKNQRFPSEKE